MTAAGAATISGPARGHDATQTIEVLRWQDEQRVAGVLARAFVDDPLVVAICNAPTPLREQRMWWSFRIALRGHSLARQPAWTIVGGDATPVGVVMVTRPRAVFPPAADLPFTLRGFLHVGWRSTRRGFEAAHVIAAHAPPQPFTYLRTLGVDPAFHGRGLGSRLVNRVIRASPPALPVYLETAKEENLSFYRRHGFEPAGEFQCLGVRLWRLMRPAPADNADAPG